MSPVVHGDTDLPQHFHHGFPLFGMLGWIKDTDMQPTGVFAAPLTPQDLREQRVSNNMKIIRSLKEGDDQGDEVHRQTCEEAASGTMLTPVPLEEWMMDKMTSSGVLG